MMKCNVPVKPLRAKVPVVRDLQMLKSRNTRILTDLSSTILHTCDASVSLTWMYAITIEIVRVM